LIYAYGQLLLSTLICSFSMPVLTYSAAVATYKRPGRSAQHL